MQKNKDFYIVILIFVNILFSIIFIQQKGILFHTDIARDFLILDNIVKTHNLTLIGPSSGIPGFFHGPLWFYMNLPAFILTKGNPVGVAWFWVMLSILHIAMTYYVSKKLFKERVALLATLLVSMSSISSTRGLMNTFGAVMLFLPFFYLFSRYIKSARASFLIGALLCVGCIIQFEIAFGGPILVLATLYTIYFISKKKRITHHLLAYAILLIPFSSYILFDLRHDFIQAKSIIAFFSTKQVGQLSFLQIFLNRLNGLFYKGLNIPFNNVLLSLPVSLLFIYIFFQLKNKKLEHRQEYALFFYFYIGFWTIMLLYQGTIWGYILSAFVPLTFLVFSSSIDIIDRRLFCIIFAYVYCLNVFACIHTLRNTEAGWNSYYGLAKTIYQDAHGNDFGYYIYSPDQLGYSEKYALSYTQKEFPNTKSFLYTKKHLTYLLIASPPPDRQFLNGMWWKSHQVNISKNPVSIFKCPDGIVVERYILDKNELSIPSDRYLIKDLIFR